MSWMPVLALANADRQWQDILINSRICLVLSAWCKLFGLLPGVRFISPAAKVLSLLLAFVLLAVLPLPQFANDKEWLAVVAVVGVALYAFSLLGSGESDFHASAVDVSVLWLLWANIAATFASHYFHSSLIGLAKQLVFVSSYFWFSMLLATSRSRSKITIAILLASGLAVAFYGLYQYKMGVAPLATWEDPAVEQQATRIYSTLGNPNLLAGYLMPLAPLALCLGAMFAFQRSYGFSILAVSIALIFITAEVLTGSRGAYIGLFTWLTLFVCTVSSFIFKQNPSEKRIYILLLAGLLLILAGTAIHFVPSFQQRLGSIFAGAEHSSNAFRLNVWKASWRMFLDNWWLGIGPGNKTFVLAYGLYMYSGFDALGTYCVPLEIAVETGVLGLTAFAMLLVVLMGRAHLAFWHAKDDFDRWLCLGCAAGLVGMMAHGLVDTVFFRPQVQFISWLLAALIASTYQRTLRDSGSQ